MDRRLLIASFNEYTKNYDVHEINISLKIAHTYRVADIAERVAGSIGANVDFSWLLGLLHDIGRFEQFKRYGTFIDRKSVDHAEFGADILFRDGLIESFPIDGMIMESWESIAETTIRLHNKLSLPDDLDPTTHLYAQILRDADKADIFRVLTEPPYDERNKRVTAVSRSLQASGVRSEVMKCVFEHRCVPRTFDMTDFESLVSSCCMAFELVYPEARRIVSEQGYLDKLLSVPVEDERMRAQLKALKEEISQFMEVEKCRE